MANMISKSLIPFLLFSQAFGAGYNWHPPPSEWGQHHSPSPDGQSHHGYGYGEHPKGWPGKHGGMSSASGSSMPPSMHASRPVGQPSGMPTNQPSSVPPAQPSKPCPPTATLDCGTIIGTTTFLPAATATVNKFLGIPFAQSPPERFGMPQRPGTCNVNATAWKPACIQQFAGSATVRAFTEYIFNNPAPEESEDCLYLNVYAPSSPPPAGGRAVMFWIYGGALQFGNAGQQYYDGSWFAGYEDVIIVTTNYRTNVSFRSMTNALTSLNIITGLRFRNFARAPRDAAKFGVLRPTLCSRVGSKKHSSFRWLS